MSSQDGGEKTPEQFEQEAYDKVIDGAIKMQTAMYSSAMTYTNAINVAGYAAIFTVWNFTRQYLAPCTTQVVALLLVVSVGVFVAFEVFKMVLSSLAILTFGHRLKAGATLVELNAQMTLYQRNERRRAIWMTVAWVPVLFITVGTALSAGVILIWNFLENILAR